MKLRIITAIVAGTAALAVLLAPWDILLTCGVSLICAVAVYEIFMVTKAVEHRGLEASAILFAVLAPFFTRISGRFIFMSGLIYALMLVGLLLKYHGRISVDKVALVFLLTVWVSVSLSCLSYLRTLDEHGLFYVFLSLLIAWMSDSGAYFVGTFFGKHKLCPIISPKKTIEGFVGGIVISIGFALLATWVYASVIMKDTVVANYWLILVLSLVCAPLSVVGDLFASIIKRRFGVKNFGNFFPGHGGMHNFICLTINFSLSMLCG